MPFEATYGFVLTLGLMLAAFVTAGVLRRKEEAPATSVTGKRWPTVSSP
jgi:hypothetical protein